jgi:hypothetical protein
MLVEEWHAETRWASLGLRDQAVAVQRSRTPSDTRDQFDISFSRNPGVEGQNLHDQHDAIATVLQQLQQK